MHRKCPTPQYIFMSGSFFFLAPDRAPLNIQWTMIGSMLTLHWDPVVAMETESKVTGYLVGPSMLQSSDLSSESSMTVFFSICLFLCFTLSGPGGAEETSLQRRQHYFDQQNHCGAQPLHQWQLSHSDQGYERGRRRCGQWTHPHPQTKWVYCSLSLLISLPFWPLRTLKWASDNSETTFNLASLHPFQPGVMDLFWVREKRPF